MSEMTRATQVGHRIWTLALPPAVLCASVASMVWSGWGKSPSPFVAIAFVGGVVGALLAVLASVAVFPIAIYDLAKHSALRTLPRVALVVAGSILAMFAILVMFGGGI